MKTSNASKSTALVPLLASLIPTMVFSLLLFPTSAKAIIIDDLHLESIEDYPIKPDGKPAHFFLTSNSKETSRVLINSNLASLSERQDIHGEIQCDNDFVFRQKYGIGSEKLVRQKSIIVWNGTTQSVDLPTNVSTCTFRFWDTNQPTRIGAVQLVRENQAFPFLRSLNQFRQSCHYKAASSETDEIFLTNDFNNISCVETADDIQTLDTPESGFTAKVEALLGAPLNPRFIKNKNPYASLDLSHTPKLDAVFVASLVFRHDFYGTVITRLLKHHADRGTLVNVMTTAYMQSDKDRAMLYKLARENGNFRFQEYTFHDPVKGLKSPGRMIDNKFRDMHIKMFVTLSSQNPANNIMILGGRNIHDGFLFKEKPDHSKFPELTQYGIDENFIHWNDFEIRIRSASMARTIYAQLLTFRNRDTLTQKMESLNVLNSQSPETAAQQVFTSSKPLMRHIVSLPFADGQALEKLFVSMIDSAQKSLKISSPYLRPTDLIAAALERAVKRGVQITIQTRINLEGDTSPWLYTEINKESINKFLDKAKIYEWTENSILHSKFLLVDGKLAFLGSVNLSRRSFVQDVENGFMIRDAAFVQKMEKIFANYNERSRLITEEQSRKFWGSLVVGILHDQF
jgi:cardiolipin synthase